MKNYSDHIISSSVTLKDGLIAINEITDEILYLLVVDNAKRLVGILTDGDIRRALISGVLLTDTIVAAMNKEFIYVKIDEITPTK